jgi:hypothetical protein
VAAVDVEVVVAVELTTYGSIIIFDMLMEDGNEVLVRESICKKITFNFSLKYVERIQSRKIYFILYI